MLPRSGCYNLGSLACTPLRLGGVTPHGSPPPLLLPHNLTLGLSDHTKSLVCQRCAIKDIKLRRNAPTCSTASTPISRIPFHHAMFVFILNALTTPQIDASPTTIVIAVSVGENVPVTIRAQPSRKSQIRIITTAHNTKQGIAAHLLHSEPRSPSTMANHSGAV